MTEFAGRLNGLRGPYESLPHKGAGDPRYPASLLAICCVETSGQQHMRIFTDSRVPVPLASSKRPVSPERQAKRVAAQYTRAIRRRPRPEGG